MKEKIFEVKMMLLVITSILMSYASLYAIAYLIFVFLLKVATPKLLIVSFTIVFILFLFIAFVFAKIASVNSKREACCSEKNKILNLGSEEGEIQSAA